MNEYLLFTSAGNKFKMFDWFSETFDTFVVYYGNRNPQTIKEKSTYFLERKGGKFQNLLFAYQSYQETFKKYKYIFVLDNDIEINNLEISFMFKLASIYNFDIIQPSLKDCERCRIDHWIMRCTPYLFAAKVSFIEVNMPLFKGELLCAFLDYLQELDKPILSGFGMDHLYINFADKIYKPETKKNYAIIHGVEVVNPKEDIREIDQYESLEKRMEHFFQLQKELNIEPIKNREYEHAYECVEELKEDFKIIQKYKIRNIPPEFRVRKPKGWYNLKFCEKIYYYATQLDHNYAKYVDKIEAKKLVKELVNIKLAPVRKYMKNYDDLCYEDIREKCIIKTSHASGWNVVVNDEKDMSKIIKKLEAFNRRFVHPHEKQYSYIEPRFYIEEIIDDKYFGKNGNALVYMIRCIYGKAICVNIKLDQKQNYYDLNWKPFYIQELPNYDKPKNLDLMIQYAEKLSSNFEFVRIDFHIDVNDDIYFSEFTFTPNAGTQVFTDELEIILGKDWI